MINCALFLEKAGCEDDRDVRSYETGGKMLEFSFEYDTLFKWDRQHINGKNAPWLAIEFFPPRRLAVADSSVLEQTALAESILKLSVRPGRMKDKPSADRFCIDVETPRLVSLSDQLGSKILNDDWRVYMLLANRRPDEAMLLSDTKTPNVGELVQYRDQRYEHGRHHARSLFRREVYTSRSSDLPDYDSERRHYEDARTFESLAFTKRERFQEQTSQSGQTLPRASIPSARLILRKKTIVRLGISMFHPTSNLTLVRVVRFELSAPAYKRPTL